jgi:hypothetical protein
LVKVETAWHQAAMAGPGAFLLSILMLGAFALTAGAIYLISSRRDRRKGVLMLVAAAVMVGNVLVWTL